MTDNQCGWRQRKFGGGGGGGRVAGRGGEGVLVGDQVEETAKCKTRLEKATQIDWMLEKIRQEKKGGSDGGGGW